MTEQTNAPDYANELMKMRHTLAQYLTVIKQQGDRIKKLEDLTQGMTPPDPHQILIDRFTESSKHNRQVNAPANMIALALHLYHIRQVPAVHIVNSGVMSQSRMQGLSSWKSQHIMDFCDLNDVRNIYEGGLGIDGMWDLVPHPEILKAALNRNTQ